MYSCHRATARIFSKTQRKSMNKINTTKLLAKKLSGQDEIEYCLWVGDGGELYVQFKTNEGGTFSNILFSVMKYASLRNDAGKIIDIEGVDLKSGETVQSCNNNDSAFLKAVLRNLIDM